MSLRAVAHRLVIALGLSALVAATFACERLDRNGADAADAAVRPVTATGVGTGGEPDRIRVAIRQWLTFAPLHVARARGFFADQGLDVEFVEIQSTSSAIPLLLRGDIDVLPGPITPGFFHAIGRGARLRFVADKGFVDPSGCAFAAIMSRPGFVEELERSIAERTELDKALPSSVALAGDAPELLVQGRRPRMALSLEPQLRYFAAEGLARYGLTLSDFETVHVPTAARLAALDAGTLDAAFLGDVGIIHAMEVFGAELWLSVDDVIPGHQFSLIAYGPRLLDEDPELGRRFMVAYLRGVRVYNEGKTDDNVSTLAEATRFEPDLLRAICWPPIRDDGLIDIPSLQAYQAWYVDQGLLDPDAVAVGFWDPSFTEHANRVLAHPGEIRK
jgi:NitT/TauT family transport system substrate-binding protein